MDDTNGQYELIPHQEISELKDELQKLREFPAGPSAKLQVSLSEVSHKLDKMISIFEEALHNTQADGGLSVAERLKPLLSKIDTLVDQQQEIAKGMVELADIVQGLKQQQQKQTPPSPSSMSSPFGMANNNAQQNFTGIPPLPPTQQRPTFAQQGMPPLPPPPRKM